MNKTTSLGTTVITNPKTNGSVRQVEEKKRPMTTIEYLRSIPSSAPIPESLMTCGELLNILVEKAELEEGMRMMLAMDTEPHLPVDVIDIIRWQNTPEYKEAHEVADKFDFAAIAPIEF